MAVAARDTDAALLVVFKNEAVPNPSKTAAAGRPIYDDREIVEIRFPGSRAVSVFPATAFSDWVTDPYTGEQKQRSYAERFAHEYRQFKSHTTQTKAGTPLQHIRFLTEARRAELQALNIYTVEALASIDGQELKNLGLGGRELKNQAEVYLAEAARGAPSSQLLAELEAVKARNQVLEDDKKALAAKAAAEAKAAEMLKAETSGDPVLDAMTDAQLKDFVTTSTGVRPVGNPARKTLLRMALDARTPPAKTG